MNRWFVCMSEIVLFGMRPRFGARNSDEMSRSARYIGSVNTGCAITVTSGEGIVEFEEKRAGA